LIASIGPSEFIPSWGATCVGARKFLIAYNVNLLGTKEQAHRIALNVREQGRSKDEVNKKILKSILFLF
jgi:glutamate formiminotransferase/formiminotetrahydrofolate cyclodeaminase